MTSTAQLDELRRASRWPRRETTLPAHRVGAMVDNMQRAVVLDGLPVIPEGVGAEDPNDAFLLAMALACEAEYVFTGSRRAGLLQRGSIGRIPIATRPPFTPTRFDAMPAERRNGSRSSCALQLMTVRLSAPVSEQPAAVAGTALHTLSSAVRSRWRFGVQRERAALLTHDRRSRLPQLSEVRRQRGAVPLSRQRPTPRTDPVAVMSRLRRSTCWHKRKFPTCCGNCPSNAVVGGAADRSSTAGLTLGRTAKIVASTQRAT